MSEVAERGEKPREYAAAGSGVDIAGALEEVWEGLGGGGDVVEDCAADVAAGVLARGWGERRRGCVRAWVVLHGVDEEVEGTTFDEVCAVFSVRGVVFGVAFADAHF